MFRRFNGFKFNNLLYNSRLFSILWLQVGKGYWEFNGLESVKVIRGPKAQSYTATRVKIIKLSMASAILGDLTIWSNTYRWVYYSLCGESGTLKIDIAENRVPEIDPLLCFFHHLPLRRSFPFQGSQSW